MPRQILQLQPVKVHAASHVHIIVPEQSDDVPCTEVHIIQEHNALSRPEGLIQWLCWC